MARVYSELEPEDIEIVQELTATGNSKIIYKDGSGNITGLDVGTNLSVSGGALNASGGGGGSYVPYSWATGDVDLGTHNLSLNKLHLATSPTVGTPATGDMYWNATDNTVDIVVDATNGVTLQVGHEQYVRIVNKTGSQINDGQVVYINGTQGNRPTVALAQANTLTSSSIIWVATQNIADNAEGNITTFGVIHGYNTSWFTAGDTLYVSTATPGLITKTAPSTPNFVAVVGKALDSTNNGHILVLVQPPLATSSTLAGNSDLVAPTEKAVKTYADTKTPLTVWTDTKDPTGFLNPDTIDVSYNYTNRTVTLTGTLDYYWRGVKYTLTSPWTSSAHTNSTGSWFLSTTDGTNFTWSNSAWAFSDMQVAFVNRGASAATSFCMRETHGTMPWQDHQEFHSRIGTYIVSGGALTAGTYTENTATDAATTPGFDAAVVKDEDCSTTVPAWTQGTYTTMYIGASSTAVFNTAATFPFVSTGSYLQINDPAAGTMTDGINNRYYNVYQILMPSASDSDSQKYRMVMLQPQAAYTTLAAAQSEVTLNFGNLTSLSTEFIIYARITYVTASGDANTGKCRIATGGVSYVTTTRTAISSTGGTNNHASLSNLTWTSSGHTGTANKVASFGSSGEAAELTVGTAASNLVQLDGSAKLPAVDGSQLTNISAGSSFWTAVAGSPTRASNTTFTVTGDYTSLFAKGMILKWTESSTVRYGMVSIPSTYSNPNTTVTIIGNTMASIDSSSLKYCLIGAEAFIANFAVAGAIGATGTDVTNAYYAKEPMIVLGADLQVGTAGTTNSTTIDINKGGTSVFWTKPTLASTVASSPTPFTADTATTLALWDKVTIDIDAVQTTAAVDLYIQLYLFPTRYANL